MCEFLYNKTAEELDELFKTELIRFAEDYGLTLDEAKQILLNVAIQDFKNTLNAI